MIGALKMAIDRFRGFGDHALSVASLDGAFRPNDTLETAPLIARLGAPDNIVQAGGRVFLSSGGQVFELLGGGLAPHGEDGAVVTAMAAAPDGRLAIAHSGQPIAVIGSDGGARTFDALNGKGDITAMCFEPDGSLAVAIGAMHRLASDWRRDLMERGSSGAVFRLTTEGMAEEIADGLAYPSGIAPDAKGGLVVSLAWESALLHLPKNKRPLRVVENLPGYPSRIIAAATGGYWLAVFAPRNQLVEFVLRETVYRQRMLAEIAPEYWVCPALAPATSPLEVMQDGAQKIGGSIKPWAPTLSYGMVVRIDEAMLPQFSYHSRANGQRHGVTSLAEVGDTLFATTHGGGAVLGLPRGR